MLKQRLQFKLSQKLSPQQIQLMKLIQLPTQAFEQSLKQEIEENPALESGKEQLDDVNDLPEDNFEYDNDSETINTDDINIDEYLSDDEIPEYRLRANNYSDEESEKSIPYAAGISFLQYLKNQLNTFSLVGPAFDIAEFLIGSIDETGYLRREIADIIDDLAFTQNIYTDIAEVTQILKLIQNQLDPPGVCAQNLQECLLLQLQRKEKTTAVEFAIAIIEKSFEAFTKKHFKKILQKYTISENVLRDVMSEVERLNPKPGSSYSGNTRMTEHVIPDFTIRITEGTLELSLNGRNAPELHVSQKYNEMLKGYRDSDKKSDSQKEAVTFIKQKLDAAKWFIDAIRQRQETLYVTMNCIMHYQEQYFLTGDEMKLKPMILKDISDIVGLDVSTVSRVVNSKYVDTPYGTHLIKDFFSESIKNNEGEDISTREIKKNLETIIENEDKKAPHTDDKDAYFFKNYQLFIKSYFHSIIRNFNFLYYYS